MSLKLENLDEKTRSLMIAEIELDTVGNSVYISPRLKSHVRSEYLKLLKEASAFQSDQWLAHQIRARGLLNSHEHRRKPKGGFSIAQVPVTTPDTLAEGEVNRYYIRALCVRAIEEGISNVEVYRAKEVTHSRSESQRKIGSLVDPYALLDDLRQNTGVDTALGLPAGPNSGLSVRLPKE